MAVGPHTVFGVSDPLERVIDEIMLASTKGRGTASHDGEPPMVRIPDIVALDQAFLDRYYAAGWPYIRVWGGEALFVGTGRNPTADVIAYWRLELETFANPVDVDFHVLYCTTPHGFVNGGEGRNAVFGGMDIGKARMLGAVGVDSVSPPKGEHRLYRYRINFVNL